jgi:hypothetical protein
VNVRNEQTCKDAIQRTHLKNTCDDREKLEERKGGRIGGQEITHTQINKESSKEEVKMKQKESMYGIIKMKER